MIKPGGSQFVSTCQDRESRSQQFQKINIDSQENLDSFKNQVSMEYQLSRSASCVARCIPPCDLCAYFSNPQGQTISSWILVYLCVCPTISTALKVFGPKHISVCYWYISNTNLEKICHFPELRIYQK